MAATYATVAGLADGLTEEFADVVAAVQAAMVAFAPHVTVGNCVWDKALATIDAQVARMALLGVDAADPLPGREE